VAEVNLAPAPVPGRGVRAAPGPGGAQLTINVFVVEDSIPKDLVEDWVMVHELAHLAFPSAPRSFHWMVKGLATCVEPVARAWAGHLTVAFV
jgi:hypothetical protein